MAVLRARYRVSWKIFKMVVYLALQNASEKVACLTMSAAVKMTSLYIDRIEDGYLLGYVDGRKNSTTKGIKHSCIFRSKDGIEKLLSTWMH